MWRIEFSSAQWKPYLSEECQGNPGVYGFELAHWLSVELMKRKIVTSYPLGEDWGWLIEYLHEEVELTIGCSSMSEPGEGYQDRPLQWSIFVRAAGGLFKKRSGPKTEVAMEMLTTNIVSILKDVGIENERVEV